MRQFGVIAEFVGRMRMSIHLLRNSSLAVFRRMARLAGWVTISRSALYRRLSHRDHGRRVAAIPDPRRSFRRDRTRVDRQHGGARLYRYLFRPDAADRTLGAANTTCLLCTVIRVTT